MATQQDEEYDLSLSDLLENVDLGSLEEFVGELLPKEEAEGGDTDSQERQGVAQQDGGGVTAQTQAEASGASQADARLVPPAAAEEVV